MTLGNDPICAGRSAVLHSHIKCMESVNKLEVASKGFLEATFLKLFWESDLGNGLRGI